MSVVPKALQGIFGNTAAGNTSAVPAFSDQVDQVNVPAGEPTQERWPGAIDPSGHGDNVGPGVQRGLPRKPPMELTRSALACLTRLRGAGTRTRPGRAAMTVPSSRGTLPLASPSLALVLLILAFMAKTRAVSSLRNMLSLPLSASSSGIPEWARLGTG